MILEQLYTKLVTNIGRRTYTIPHLDERQVTNDYSKVVRAHVPVEDANLVSSEIDIDRHAPAIDLDFPAYLLASSTPGHFHFYIETELTWDQYKALLWGFLKAGLIQKAWHDTAVNDHRSYLRLPHVRKGDNP